MRNDWATLADDKLGSAFGPGLFRRGGQAGRNVTETQAMTIQVGDKLPSATFMT
jgi:hypothetical protein